MQYTIRVEIDLPRAEVFECYTNPNLYSTWMESLVSMEILQGEPEEVGTRTQMAHKMGKREIGMLETVTHREFPSRSVATYEADGVWNQAINHFEEIEGGGTAWVMETEFQCKGLMWLITTLMPGMFKKQTRQTMEAFKAFIEGRATEE
jgi:uncharacterized protein YndB with AHSA1/START domain